MGSYSWWRLKRLLSRPLPWILALVFVAFTWWGAGATQGVRPHVQQRLRNIFPSEYTKDLQFIPASNPKIHFVGRWTKAPNHLRTEGAFPGIYFDLNITNTSTLLLSLQNSKAQTTQPTNLLTSKGNVQQSARPTAQYSQYSFHDAAYRLRVSAPPVSLLALVDDEEYVVFPNASSLVPIRMKDLNPQMHHTVRVVAPMNDKEEQDVVQFEGLWLDKGGQLSLVEGSAAENGAAAEENFDPDGPEIGKSHRLGLSKLLNTFNSDQIQKSEPEPSEEGRRVEYKNRKKLIEIVTDIPSHLTNVRETSRIGGADGLLSGVMGWEYLLGEMFSVDHVCIGVEGMCLVHDCIGGTGEPSGMADVFFRSGPTGTAHFGHPWTFQQYVPDVLIFNLGASDFYSFDHHLESYNHTGGDLLRSFEETYVSLVRSVRNLAYPNHPSIIEMQRLGLDNPLELNAPATIPIFIMRPFGGELEHATQGAVNRLRNEGDKSVYWLDTTGWLDFEDTETTQSDFFVDPNEPDRHLHLTERGNQKVAIYLHMHVCRYLAANEDKCAFLPPEVYEGNVYDPSVATFDRYIENEKERQMKEIFWQDEAKDAL
ncbi:MAG: hypothetical protein M1831_005452 [Alyxoria varia]|nr:MAG: hypothetical protein M1831_005452 [Alyxoria varia]